MNDMKYRLFIFVFIMINFIINKLAHFIIF